MVILVPAVVAAWKLSRPGQHGSASFGVNDGVVSGQIVEAGKTIWSGSITMFHLVLLAAIPPLLLWLLWLVSNSRTNNAGEKRLKNQTTNLGLNASPPGIGIIDTTSPSTSKRREREES
jgi:hypothetical protein